MRVLIPLALVYSFSPLAAQTDGAAFYESSVKPILKANCLGCHSDKNLTSGLSLETRESILKGGNRGADLELIAAAVRHSGDLKMPPGKKLGDEQIATLSKWVGLGVPVPAALEKSRRPGANHWAFQPVRKPAPPAIGDQSWIRNSIDRFILAKLDAANLKPSPEADKATLLRRVHLDLTGIPPTPKELAEFLADDTPGAYAKVVERLLASPHYGERWGRHWLDLARYADSDGYTIDAPRDIWKYRDWVIDAVNKDMPFTQFVVEQIAGDLLPNPTTDQLIATGFHRNTTSNFEGGIDFEQYRVEAVADRVATTGAVFLGLTLGCARCHDHKYDPISQREFYQIFSFYNNTEEIDKEDDRKYFNRPFLELPTPEESARRSAYNAQLTALEAEFEAYKKPLGEEAAKKDLGVMEREKNIRNLKSREPKVTSTLIMREKPTPRQAYIHLGGEFTRKGATVQPGVPSSIQPALNVEGRRPNRVDLARWLVDDRNPLTPRVTVNRIWQKYFGKGFVDTESDLGAVGDKPTHPELLDWLAAEFMTRGWSQKELHRLIVHSATYRQASKARQDATAVDPDNRLLARQNRLRLEAEIVRDASLQVSGLFAPAVGGPSVYPPQPPGVYQVTQVRREWKTSEGADRFRRGMYTFFQRSAPHPSLVVFDAPDSTTTCTRRNRSNTPLQALTQLNDEGSVEWANALAKRVESEAPDDTQRLRQAYLYALNREPNSAEQDRLLRFLKSQRDSKSQNAWGAVARVILNLDEFLTRP